MTSVLEKEIEMQRRVEVLKRDLHAGFDYAHLAAFRSVDRYNDGRINTINLGSFLRSIGHHSTEMELLSIIRRIDTDGDCEISMPEWSEFMSPLVSPLLPPAPPLGRPIDLPPPRAYSPLRHSPLRPLTRTEEVIERSRIARSLGRTMPVVRRVSPTRTIIDEVPVDPYYPLPPREPLDPYYPLPPRDPLLSPLPREPLYPLSPRGRPLPRPLLADPYRLSPTRKPILRPFEEDELVHSLRDQCNLEAEMEAAKIALARHRDFNIHDSFAIFDINRDGRIHALELRDGLSAIGVHVTLDECDVIVARYDRTGDGMLN